MKGRRRRRRPELRSPAAGLCELDVLDRRGVAKWLGVSERTIDRLALPHLPLTDGLRRFMVRDVLRALEARANSRNGKPAA